jgi:hypothetical protein
MCVTTNFGVSQQCVLRQILELASSTNKLVDRGNWKNIYTYPATAKELIHQKTKLKKNDRRKKLEISSVIRKSAEEKLKIGPRTLPAITPQ